MPLRFSSCRLQTVWTTTHPVVPCVWRCSECDAAFDLGPRRPTPRTLEQVDKMNHEFEIHFKHVHPDARPIIGIDFAG